MGLFSSIKDILKICGSRVIIPELPHSRFGIAENNTEHIIKIMAQIEKSMVYFQNTLSAISGLIIPAGSR